MDYVSFVGGDVVIVGGEAECFDLEVLADKRRELLYFETDETEALFVFERLEPVDDGCGVFALV